MRFSLLVDSVVDTVEKIPFVPADVISKEWVKLDKVEIGIAEVCELLRNGEVIKTAAAAPGRFLKKILELSEPVLVLTIAGAYSSMLKSAQLAAKMAGKTATVVDSNLISIGAGLLAHFLEELRKNGASIEEAVKFAGEVSNAIKVYVIPRNITYLARSGRIPELVSKLSGVANKLEILPVIELCQGKFRLLKLVRGFENGIKELAKLAKGSIAIVGSTDNKDAEDMLAEFVEENGIEVLRPWQISAALAAHLGPDAVGIAFSEVKV